MRSSVKVPQYYQVKNVDHRSHRRACPPADAVPTERRAGGTVRRRRHPGAAGARRVGGGRPAGAAAGGEIVRPHEHKPVHRPGGRSVSSSHDLQAASPTRAGVRQCCRPRGRPTAGAPAGADLRRAPGRLRRWCGCGSCGADRIDRADPDFVRQARTGFAIGGVPPAGCTPNRSRRLVDVALADHSGPCRAAGGHPPGGRSRTSSTVCRCCWSGGLRGTPTGLGWTAGAVDPIGVRAGGTVPVRRPSRACPPSRPMPCRRSDGVGARRGVLTSGCGQRLRAALGQHLRHHRDLGVLRQRHLVGEVAHHRIRRVLRGVRPSSARRPGGGGSSAAGSRCRTRRPSGSCSLAISASVAMPGISGAARGVPTAGRSRRRIRTAASCPPWPSAGSAIQRHVRRRRRTPAGPTARASPASGRSESVWV